MFLVQVSFPSPPGIARDCFILADLLLGISCAVFLLIAIKTARRSH
jgi:hypothetical protein